MGRRELSIKAYWLTVVGRNKEFAAVGKNTLIVHKAIILVCKVLFNNPSTILINVKQDHSKKQIQVTVTNKYSDQGHMETMGGGEVVKGTGGHKNR